MPGSIIKFIYLFGNKYQRQDWCVCLHCLLLRGNFWTRCHRYCETLWYHHWVSVWIDPQNYQQEFFVRIMKVMYDVLSMCCVYSLGGKNWLNRPAPLGTKADSKHAMWGKVPNRAKKENIHTTESEYSNFPKSVSTKISTDLVTSCPS